MLRMRSLFHHQYCKALFSFCLVVWVYTKDSIAQTEKGITSFKSFIDSGRLADHSTPFFITAYQHSLPAALTVVRQLDDHVAIVRLKPGLVFNDLKYGLTIVPANDSWKWSPAFSANSKGKNNATDLFIVSGENLEVLLTNIKGSSAQLIQQNKTTNTVIIRCSLEELKKGFLPDPNIIFIDRYIAPSPEVGIIGYDRSFHGTNAIDHTMPGVNGRDIVVGVKEQKMEAQDLDLFKRVLPSPIAHSNTEMHATVIASIIGGAGNSFYDGRGVANHSLFFPSSFSNLFADDASILDNNKVSVQNHSYGTIIQQFYGAEALSYDIAGWLDKKRLHIFSAGNRGQQAATEGPYAGIAGFANVTGNFKMAKDIIAVAAIDNKENIISESSLGPAYDGRLLPQLTALGPNGTSDAAAMVTGAVAVLQQSYKDSNSNQLPPAALIKAILYNNADDIGRRGIDFKTGYGVLNTLESVKQLQQKHYWQSFVSQGQEWTQALNVPAGIAEVKVSLSWTDSASSLNNPRALLNDLDLTLEKDGIIFQPWVLNHAPHIDSLNKQAIRGRDSINTAEQISVRLPAAGIYTVKVKGSRIANGTIPFSISYKLDTLNRFEFTSPQHSSDINYQENTQAFVRWKTNVADTNTTGNLFISFNNGQQWHSIQPNYKIYRNKYLWTVKDTNSIAQFKMETAFGDFYSKTFFLGTVCRPRVDFFCADSFRLSWPKHLYANSYKMFALVDSPYLKHMFTVSDSFYVFHRNEYPQLVWAVEPVLQNGIGATRSLAMDVSLQGVKCFYKTFYHVLQDENRLQLNLELSAAAYADSIYFEQVTVNGTLLRTVGTSSVISNQVLYSAIVNDIPEGTSYWRAKIVLNSGAVVYTDIIEVLSTGRKYVLFYPNPATRQQPLQFILQQGYTQGTQLLLFEASGRLIRHYREMPTNIDVSDLAPGLIIYKLVKDNSVLETGKVILL